MSACPEAPTTPPPSRADSLRGRRLGPYRVVTELGAGGMGSVWYAEHDGIGRRVAIKVLHPALSAEPEPVARFLREARAANAIGHPNIVDVTDLGEQDGLVYLVMELLEGETLGARLERGALSLEETLPIVTEIVGALRAAHARGIVHRDLKPENVFLEADGGVKLLDFGIAKLSSASVDVSGDTRPGEVLGTPRYMAPEQCVSSEVDHRADQYALGVLIYEALVGEPPFDGGFGRLVLAHTTQEPTRLDERASSVPRKVADVVHRALAKRPRDRYPDVAAFLDALDEASGRPPSLPPPSPNRAERRERERRQSASLAHQLTRILRRRLAYGRAQLPSMPHVAMRGLAAMDEGQNLGAIGAILEGDPMVASRLVGLANSAALGGRARIASVGAAVTRLGVGRLRVLLLEHAARTVFTSNDPRIRMVFARLWEHCLAVGTLARGLASEIDRGPDPDEAYLAGFLHDVGKPVVGAFLLDAERQIAELDAGWVNDAVWLQVVERTHREAGIALARAWELPVSVRSAIEQPDDYIQDGSALGNLVRYADALARLEGLDAGDIDHADAHAVALDGRRLFDLDERAEAKICMGLAARVAELTG